MLLVCMLFILVYYVVGVYVVYSRVLCLDVYVVYSRVLCCRCVCCLFSCIMM